MAIKIQYLFENWFNEDDIKLVDEEKEEQMKIKGYELVASGYNTITGWRDLVFEKV